MNKRRTRAIINQKLKSGYFKNMNSAIMFNHEIMMCPNKKYIKKIMKQHREKYDSLRRYVDGIQ